MTFFQLIKEIFDNSRERVKTPITGAFFTAFILYNWRPILQLMFSKMAMEDRIGTADHAFIDNWSWLAPLLIALGYVILLPFISHLIEWFIDPVKVLKMTKTYKFKGYELDEKILISRKELKLKNALSDNSELQDYVNQVEQLKISKEQLQQEANLRVQVEIDKNKHLLDLQENSNAEINVLRSENRELKVENTLNTSENIEIIKVLAKLDVNDLLFLHEIRARSKSNLSPQRNEKTDLYLNLKLIEFTQNNKIILTKFGNRVIDIT